MQTRGARVGPNSAARAFPVSREGGAEHTNRGHVRVRTFHRATYSTEHAARPTEPSSLKIKVRVHPRGKKVEQNEYYYIFIFIYIYIIYIYIYNII